VADGAAAAGGAVDKEREAALKRRRELAEAAAAAAEKRLKTETTADAEPAGGVTCGGVEPSEPAMPAIVTEQTFIDLTMEESPSVYTTATDADGNPVLVPLYDDEDYNAFSHPSGPRPEFPLSANIGFFDGTYIVIPDTPAQTVGAPIVVDPSPEDTRDEEEVVSVATEEQKEQVEVAGSASPVVSVATEEQKEKAEVAGSASPVVSVATEEQKEQVEVAGSASPVVSVATEEQKEQVEVAGSASPVGSPDLFADPNATAGGSPVHLTHLSATSPSAATETIPLRSMMVTSASSATIARTAPQVYPDGSMFVGPVGEGILKFNGVWV
jgi:hypothetical protein